jgi:2-polyprenyl-3-methyl-5-hydroxy-6-metoxy-1,4-benzoquinol methylase
LGSTWISDVTKVRRIHPELHWPDSWRKSYDYDLQEIYGQVSNRGYFYAYDNRRRHAISLLTEALAPAAKILDIGAAQGNFSLQLAEMGFEVTWNDVRGELAEYVRLKHERGTLHFAVGNAFELQFAQPFDAVLITEIIEHVAHPDDFLAKVAELLRPGGYIIMTTPNGAYFRNKLPRFSDCPDPSVYEAIQFKPDSDGHIFLLHTDEVHQFAVKAGLRVDKLQLFTNPLTNGRVKLGYALRLLPSSAVERIETLTQRLPAAVANRLLIQMAVRLQKPASVAPSRLSIAARGVLVLDEIRPNALPWVHQVHPSIHLQQWPGDSATERWCVEIDGRAVVDADILATWLVAVSLS